VSTHKAGDNTVESAPFEVEGSATLTDTFFTCKMRNQSPTPRAILFSFSGCWIRVGWHVVCYLYRVP